MTHTHTHTYHTYSHTSEMCEYVAVQKCVCVCACVCVCETCMRFLSNVHLCACGGRRALLSLHLSESSARLFVLESCVCMCVCVCVCVCVCGGWGVQTSACSLSGRACALVCYVH